LAGAVGRSAHHPEVGATIIRGSAVLMIDISAIAFVNASLLLHQAASCVPFGAAFELSGGTLVVPIFFGVVSCGWHGCGVLNLVGVFVGGWGGAEDFLEAVARVDGAVQTFAGHGEDDVGVDSDPSVISYNMNSSAGLRLIHSVPDFIP